MVIFASSSISILSPVELERPEIIMLHSLFLISSFSIVIAFITFISSLLYLIWLLLCFLTTLLKSGLVCTAVFELFAASSSIVNRSTSLSINSLVSPHHLWMFFVVLFDALWQVGQFSFLRKSNVVCSVVWKNQFFCWFQQK